VTPHVKGDTIKKTCTKKTCREQNRTWTICFKFTDSSGNPTSILISKHYFESRVEKRTKDSKEFLSGPDGRDASRWYMSYKFFSVVQK
jgi:hypothetical protein